MSIKKYFDRAQNLQALANKSAEDIAGQVESVGYHEQDIIDEERFIPRVDFSDPANFVRYGSAQEYYDQTIKRIYNEYPYDGSLRERLEWRNESNYLDLYVFDNLYPRTNGHIILSALGGATSALEDGYGNPSTPEYILVKGGPNSHPEGSTPIIKQFTGSNYYEPDKNRGSNLEFDLATKGATVEFWLNKSEFVISDTQREVVFDLWNGQLSSSANYFRFRVELSASGPATGGQNPFLVTILSGTTGVFRQSVAASTFTTASVADGNWHHYALTFASASAGIETKFYVDGNLNNSTTLGSNGINNTLHNGFRAHIGALITNISGNAYGASSMAGYGKLSGSIDEFRYWKKRRTSQEIGRFWFTQVGGGVNTDPTPFTTNQETANVDLGVYYKFNEGISGRTATDSTVLDYSGRFSNGSWTGYNTSARSTGSAMVLSTAATSEFQDPIIYSFHPDVVTLAANLDLSGSSHDGYNNASIYKTIPSWITEQDEEGEKNVKYLTQIISSYFDTLHLQIDSLNKLKNIEYPSGSQKPLPFGERLLSGYGFVAPDIFVDADVLEVLADRSEDRVYEKSLHDIKNIIYQNIYNNLNYIYKSKGTEKAFRNLIRCFGIDDELVKINSYANNIQYEMRNNRRNVVSADRYANFNSGGNTDANVYNFTDASNSNSVGFIPATAELFNGYATTLETEVLFPLKRESNTVNYAGTNTISASLFGIHGANSSGTETTWHVNDFVNFQVYAVRDEIDSTNAKFVLTGTTDGLVPSLESALYQDVYNNKRWNLSVRIKPSEYPFKSLISVTSSNYVVELHGVHAEAGEIIDEFTVSGTVATPNMGFLTGSRRAFVGAHRTNFTGTLLQSSDVKINACRFWLDSLSDQTLRGHILDTENHGTLQPDLYAFPFNTSASAGDVRKVDTLVFNWEFLNNTGSDANGRFTVADISSGSAAFTRFGALSSLLNRQYSARGDNFTPSSTTAIDKDFVMSSRLNLPENVQSEDMIRVLTAQEQDVFTNESRPVNYFFAFEKSMAQVISEEIINYFADLTTFHNLIGAPVNKYREEYKEIKLLRNRFFEKVGNTEIDFDRFYEFYKWFDSSMSIMLNQLVPASAEFSDNVRTIIESHALERSKYKNIFPFLQRKGAVDITGSIDGQNVIDGTAGASPDDFPAGTQLFSNTAFTKRQIGSSRVNQMTNWKFYHAPATANKAAPVETENHYWHKYREERPDAGRSAIHGVITQSYNRTSQAPVKFSVEGAISLGGVGKHPAYKPNYVFNATEPYGPIGTNTSPENIMVVEGADVEKLIQTSDVYYPNLRQRLGFKMKPGINSGEDNAFDGNMYAPFSLYSSSITTGYNSTVVSNFTSSVEITNLHNDFVVGANRPLQGPFTEKYVGGRAYRHTALNDGTDTVATRAEGFRIQFENVTASNGSTFNNSLAVLPPNNLGGATDSTIPTAARFRDETAKRPVNIRNIRMTTGSTVIGNYEKNYQVIQTAGRTQNDPFFNDQSFDFAPYPETLATRGRFPLYEPDPVAAKSVLFGGGNAQDAEYLPSYFTASNADGVFSALSGAGNVSTSGFSTSFWFNRNQTPLFNAKNMDFIQLGMVFQQNALGGAGYRDGFRIMWFQDSAVYRFEATLMKATSNQKGGYAQQFRTPPESLATTASIWTHVVISYPPNSINGANNGVPNAGLPTLFLNGVSSSIDIILNNGFGFDALTARGADNIGLTVGEVANNSGYAANDNNNYDGFLCDLAFFTQSMTTDQVALLYNNGVRVSVDSIPDFTNTLVSYYRLGNGSSGATVDANVPSFYDSVTEGKGGDGPGFGATVNFNLGATSPSGSGIRTESPSAVLQDNGFGDLYGPGNLPTNNVGGLLNYTLPERTGSASNKTVIVNRYAGSGYEVMSLGYMDPAHEELSVYNAAPYHNLSVINHGLSGSTALDFLEAKTIAVVDHLSKNRGLNQRATLHAGPYGIDAAYGSISPDSYGYATQPSWHKTNRNRQRRPEFKNANLVPAPGVAATAVYATGSTFDNLYIQHAIPRSEQQYAWVTASLAENQVIYGLDQPSCFSASTLSQVITSSGMDYRVGYPAVTTSGSDGNLLEYGSGHGTAVPFVGANLAGPAFAQSIDLGTHTVGRSLGAFDSKSLFFSGTWDDDNNGALVAIGSGSTDWDPIIGGTGANAKPFTFSCWIMALSGAANGATQYAVNGQRIIDIGNSDRRLALTNARDASDNIVPHKYATSLTIDGASDGQATSLEMEFGIWYHVVGTFAGGNNGLMQIFLNGQVANRDTQNMPLNNPGAIAGLASIGNRYTLGSAASSFDRGFYGYINEVAIFSAELTKKQIELLYNYGATPNIGELPSVDPTFPLSSLEAYWRMGDATNRAGPNRITDLSKNSLDGDIQTIGSAVAVITSSVPPSSFNYSFNSLMLSRNGPYGYPMWKQTRTGEHKLARALRAQNKIGTVLPPSKIPEIINGNLAGFIQPTRPNTFVDYVESPVDSRNRAIVFSFEDNTENSNPENNIIVSVPYGNDIEYFNNDGLNNRLGLTVDMDRRRSYHSVRDFALDSNLSVVVNYGERIFPSAKNVYTGEIRRRQNYTIHNIWNVDRTKRSFTFGLNQTSSTGFIVTGSSIWPLDAHLNWASYPTGALALSASDGAGELQSLGARFTSGSWGAGSRTAQASTLALRNNGAGNLRFTFLNYTETTASACYAMRVYGGYTASNGTLRQPRPVFAGDVPWVAPEQAGKVPYKPYTDFSDKLSRLGKDFSLVPEFRISTLMRNYLDDRSGDFTDDVDALFNLTGASVPNSSEDDFYTIYSNGDFLKYFKFVDDDLYDKRSGDLKIVRDKIELSCDALLKFLPYKGFYPAERTLELSTLFSQSFAASALTVADWYNAVNDAQYEGFDPAGFRIAMEPLYAPGIMYNTIKSGIGVSNYIIVNPSGTILSFETPEVGALYTGFQFYQASATALPEGNILYGMGTGSSGFQPGNDQGSNPAYLPVSSSCPITAIASGSNESNGKMIKKVPFEVLQRPSEFFKASSMSTVNGTTGGKNLNGTYFVLDTAPSGSHHWSNSWVKFTNNYYTQRSTLLFTERLDIQSVNGRSGDFTGGKLYELAIDNFLCETTNFFMLGPSNFQSAREENFKPVVSGTVYQMQLNLYRSSNTGSLVPDDRKFEMYSRASAFGAPLVADDVSAKTKQGSTNNFSISDISFSHVTPPYYAGSGSARFIYTASYDGRPTLDEILSEATIDFSRQELVNNVNAENAKFANKNRPSERGHGLNEDFRVQLDSSYNLLEKIQEVPSGSTEIKNRWLIQSKFETPILNFAGVSTGSQFLPSNDTKGGASQARDIITRGMWHQYGSLLTGSDVGVFASISDVGENSLADIVGFEKGVVKRVGAVRPDKIVKEAVVAVPFKTVDGERRFIDLPVDNPQIDYTRSNTYKKMAQALDTYVFPPKFDFKRFGSVNPVLMYVFEFSVKFTQQDLADMWQNLPPDLEERFQRQNAVVEERELIDLITSKNEDIEWMVFKVKQRANKDYDRFRRSLVTNDVSNLPVRVRTPLTYNWPYDYFSIVELARIEESAQYVSTDIKKLAPVSDLERLDIQRTPIPGAGISERQRRQNQSRSPRSRTPQIEQAPAGETTRAPQVSQDERVRGGRAPQVSQEVLDALNRGGSGAPQTEQATFSEPVERPRRRRRRRRRPTSTKPIKKNKKDR